MTDAEVLTSEYAAAEARRNLRRKKPDRLSELDRLIGGLQIVAEPETGGVLPEGVNLPEDDRPILLAAMEARATHLLTGNHRHFGPYYGQAVAGVLILRPTDYPPFDPTGGG